MARGSCTFKQRDVKCAVKAVVAAGVLVRRVEIDKAGKIVVVAANSSSPQNADLKEQIENEWDSVS
jgi:predicted site-specific integrase-resolvase